MDGWMDGCSSNSTSMYEQPASPAPPADSPARTTMEIIETMDVDQGKLVMGGRTGVTWNDPDIFPLTYYNGIFGGFAHSKLFVNVRERA